MSRIVEKVLAQVQDTQGTWHTVAIVEREDGERWGHLLRPILFDEVKQRTRLRWFRVADDGSEEPVSP